MSGAMKCSPIYLENISTTIDSIKRTIFEPLNISSEHWTSDIGSVGKKPVSGDIDIAVDINHCNPKEIVDLVKNSGFDFKQTGGAIANIAFPIKGTQKGEYVQVDLFPTKSLEFTKFARFSPSIEESEYNGGMRSDLLGILIKYCTTVRLGDREFSYISLKQDGAYRTFRYVDRPQYRTEHEDVLITDKPEVLLWMIFGDKYNTKHFNSVESIISLMLDEDFAFKHIVKDVFKRFKEVEEKKEREIPNKVKEICNE